MAYSKDELEDLCEAAEADPTVVSGLPIFSRLQEFEKYGKFGNADLYYPSDWVEVGDETDKLGTATWDSDTDTCTIYSSVLITITYHKMGLSGNLQQYVVDVRKEAVWEHWQYPTRYIPRDQDSRAVDFTHFVIVQYVELPDAGEGAEGVIPLPPVAVSREMFYPAFLRTLGATFTQVSILTILTSALMLYDLL